MGAKLKLLYYDVADDRLGLREVLTFSVHDSIKMKVSVASGRGIYITIKPVFIWAEEDPHGLTPVALC